MLIILNGRLDCKGLQKSSECTFSDRWQSPLGMPRFQWSYTMKNQSPGLYRDSTLVWFIKPLLADFFRHHVFSFSNGFGYLVALLWMDSNLPCIIHSQYAHARMDVRPFHGCSNPATAYSRRFCHFNRPMDLQGQASVQRARLKQT